MLQSYPAITMIPCIDIGRAQQFYEGKLGLKPAQETPAIVYVCQGGTSFTLYPSSFAGTAKNTAMNWLVDDIGAVMADLRAGGVVFLDYDLPEAKTINGVAEFPGGRAAWFKDTEGNILGLTQLD
jgi:catechol 2,3-dioxygenase-like lactoylglutathione lyase family enzyme